MYFIFFYYEVLWPISNQISWLISLYSTNLYIHWTSLTEFKYKFYNFVYSEEMYKILLKCFTINGTEIFICCSLYWFMITVILVPQMQRLAYVYLYLHINEDYITGQKVKICFYFKTKSLYSKYKMMYFRALLMSIWN